MLIVIKFIKNVFILNLYINNYIKIKSNAYFYYYNITLLKDSYVFQNYSTKFLIQLAIINIFLIFIRI